MSSLAVVAVVVLGYTIVAARLERWSISAPLVLVAAGAILGPSGFGSIAITPTDESLKVLAELSLAILLFADASVLRLWLVEHDARLPVRLLAIGLPLTIVLGSISAVLVLPGAGLSLAALIATILAPTDAALGLPIVTSPSVPSRIRRLLNIESGLNDGIATPVLTLILALVVAEEGGAPEHWIATSVTQIGIAVLVAVVVGGGGGWLLAAARRREWASDTSARFAIATLAVLAYAGAVTFGGNGFVAAFAAGLLFNAGSGGKLREPGEFAELVGLLGAMGVWVLFGVAYVGPAIMAGPGPSTIAYAVLSLTLVRMLPVAIALVGTRFGWPTIGFIGWFGPRGLASVVFTLVALDELGPTPGARLVVDVATWTILISVVAHGLSASPLAAWYGRYAGRLPATAPERIEVPDARVRHRAVSADPSGPRSA